MRVRPSTIGMSLAMIAALLPLAAALADQPDPHQRPLIDGCQRTQAGILAMTNPEWVYVNRAQVLQDRLNGDPAAGRQTAEGLVEDIHPAGNDLYWDHEFGDVDIDIKLDPQYGFLARSGEDGIGLEWEDALLPMWAWPQNGDHVKVSGSYIWDCGHWGDGGLGPGPAGTISALAPYDPYETAQDLADPGTISGESTELHPLYEVGTYRTDAAGLLAGTPSVLARLDAWVSGDGGWALGEEECALLGLPTAATRACSRYRDVGGTYSYTMTLPPKPVDANTHTLIVNPVVVHSETDAALAATIVNVVPDETNGKVSVSFTLPHDQTPQHFGISVEAGWSADPTPVVHQVATISNIHFEKSLDGAQQLGGSEPNQNPVNNGPELLNLDPGEWVMVAQANGHWQWFLPTPSRTGLVMANTDIQPGTTFDYYLPAGVTPRLFVNGRECDIPHIDCLHDYYGGHEQTPLAELGYNDHPGRVIDNSLGNFKDTGRPMTPGSNVYRPRANPGTGPSSGNEWDSDYTCGATSCYSITATLTSTPV
jgi:hypothetical protein